MLQKVCTQRDIIDNTSTIRNFIYNGSSMWNMFRACPEGSEIEDFLVGVSYVKIKIRELLLCRQKQGDQEEWDESNFSIR